MRFCVCLCLRLCRDVLVRPTDPEINQKGLGGPGGLTKEVLEHWDSYRYEAAQHNTIAQHRTQHQMDAVASCRRASIPNRRVSACELTTQPATNLTILRALALYAAGAAAAGCALTRTARTMRSPERVRRCGTSGGRGSSRSLRCAGRSRIIDTYRWTAIAGTSMHPPTTPTPPDRPLSFPACACVRACVHMWLDLSGPVWTCLYLLCATTFGCPSFVRVL